jgi:spermidine/putrescine transport system permease protein
VTKPRLSRTVFWTTIVFLFLPLVVLMVFSFNEGRTMVWKGFSLKWYESLFTAQPRLWGAVVNTLIVAFTSSILATVIGTMGAIAINWYRFKAKSYVQSMSFLPLILPEIIIGVSLLIFFRMIGLPLSIWTIILAHTSFTLPFVLLMVMARLGEFDNSIIEAARDLGARESQILWKVILPISVPGILAGFLMAFTLSLEDFVVTFFVTGSGSDTLPIFIYNQIKRKLPPEINAFSVVLIAATVFLLFFARRSIKYFVQRK